MKRMLFNATQPEELRVAIVDGQRLIDLDIESTRKEQRKSNIYKGVVTRVEPSLEAAFIDYGVDRHGFLPFKEISRQYLRGESGENLRGRVGDLLREGHELMVQVDKDERGNKGAALTTYISLAGRYLVLMPNNPRGGGVSRRVEGEDRAELREVMNNLELPEGMSTIARTAGIGRSAEELQWDLNYLMRLWEAIESASEGLKAPQLLYRESNLVIRAIRDLYHPEIGEILIDSPAIHKDALDFVRLVIPGSAPKVKLYQDEVPLFSRFQIEHQIETAYRREVALPSGGAIVIDKTEALSAIDVNSARATKGADIEQTALNTNLEAADEIARQLRLRDLGGLIVVDFIDMENPRNQRDVENRFRDALKYDRARVQTGKISRFGMMELSRQRLQGSIAEASHSTCPRCSGIGQIRDVPSSSLHILRLLGEEAMKDNTALVRAQVPVAVATYLLNEKRAELAALEARLKVHIILIPNTALETPNFSVERVRPDEMGREDLAVPSYEMAATLSEEEEESPREASAEVRPPRLQPVVKGITPDQPAPLVEAPAPRVVAVEAKPESPGFFSRLFGWFKTPAPNELAEPASTPAATPVREHARDDQRRRGGRHEHRDRNERGGREHNRNDAQAPRTEGQRPPQERGDRQGRREGGGERDRNARRDQGRNEQRNEQRGDQRNEQRNEQRNDGRNQRPPGGGRPDQQRGPRSQQQQQPQPEREGAAPTPGVEAESANAFAEGNEHRRGRRGGRRSERGGERGGEAQRGGQGQHPRNGQPRPPRSDMDDNGAREAANDSAPPEHSEAPRRERDHERAPMPVNEAAFVPQGERIVTDAFSLPRLVVDESQHAPATPAAPAAPAVVAVAAATRAPQMEAPQLGDLELVTTRPMPRAQEDENEVHHERNRRGRGRRRPQRTQRDGQNELVLVETANAPAVVETSAAPSDAAEPGDQGHHGRRHRPQRERSPGSEPLVQIETQATD